MFASQCIVGRIFIHLGEGWVVVAGVNEDVGALLEKESRETDVDEIGRLLADTVDPEKLHVLRAEEQLQETIFIADDKASAILRVEGFTDDIGDIFFAEGLLAFPSTRAFRDGVDAKRQDAR